MSAIWFRLYSYTHPVHDEDTGERLLPPTWGPAEGEPVHTFHPDRSDPDRHVRYAFARAEAAKGTTTTACGKELDPRLVYVEAHAESERCAACVAALKAGTDGDR